MLEHDLQYTLEYPQLNSATDLHAGLILTQKGNVALHFLHIYIFTLSH